MKMQFLIITLILVSLAIVLFCRWLLEPKQETTPASPHRQKGFHRTWRRMAGPPTVAAMFLALLIGKPPRLRAEFVNMAEGTAGIHAGAITKRADAAHASRYLLVKFGSDTNHIAVTGVNDQPLGSCPDQPMAAEDPAAVLLFGSASKTMKLVASEQIVVGDLIVPGASGKARKLPVANGTYYLVGRAISAAGGDGDQFEVDPMPCIQRVVS